MRFSQACTVFAILSSVSVNCTPLNLFDIKPFDDQGNNRYQATEDVDPSISDEEIKAKNKAFHEGALQVHKDTGGPKRLEPGMSAAQLKGNTLYHSTTANGANPNPALNPAYQGAIDAASTAAHGKACSHRSNGKCAEGGTTSQILSHNPDNMAGQRISSYGTAARPDTGSKQTTGFHQGCKGGEAGIIGCSDMINHNDLNDLNKLKPGRSQSFQDKFDVAQHGAPRKPTSSPGREDAGKTVKKNGNVEKKASALENPPKANKLPPSPGRAEADDIKHMGKVSSAMENLQPGWTKPQEPPMLPKERIPPAPGASSSLFGKKSSEAPSTHHMSIPTFKGGRRTKRDIINENLIRREIYLAVASLNLDW